MKLHASSLYFELKLDRSLKETGAQYGDASRGVPSSTISGPSLHRHVGPPETVGIDLSLDVFKAFKELEESCYDEDELATHHDVMEAEKDEAGCEIWLVSAVSTFLSPFVCSGRWKSHLA